MALHVLVVEDDAVCGESLRRMIDRFRPDAAITLVSAAEDALSFLPGVHAVITDHRLAGAMTGDQLRVAAEARGLPVLLISGVGVVSHSGNAAVVEKGNREDLLCAVCNLLDQFQGIRRVRTTARRLAHLTVLEAVGLVS